MLGFLIFGGLMPLTFTFSNKGAHLLLDTQYKYLILCIQVVVMLLLLMGKHTLAKKQLMGGAIFYALVPFTFSFGAAGIHFPVLVHYSSSILSWLVASVLVSRWYYISKI